MESTGKRRFLLSSHPPLKGFDLSKEAFARAILSTNCGLVREAAFADSQCKAKGKPSPSSYA